MPFRKYLDKLKDSGKLIQVDTPISQILEAAGILHALEPDPVLFSSIKENAFQVVGNLFTTKSSIPAIISSFMVS